MYSLSVIFIFSSTLAFAFATTPLTPSEQKEAKAIQECNATIPIQKNPRVKIDVGIATGEGAKLNQEEKCFLNCYLQKVGFLNENSTIRNGVGLVNYTLRQSPEMANYSDVLIAHIFVISRSTKGIDDKCLRAFVIYQQFVQGLFTFGLANALQTEIHIKDKIIHAIETGQKVDEHISDEVKEFLLVFDGILKILLSFA